MLFNRCYSVVLQTNNMKELYKIQEGSFELIRTKAYYLKDICIELKLYTLFILLWVYYDYWNKQRYQFYDWKSIKINLPIKQICTKDSLVKRIRYDIRLALDYTIDCISSLLGIHPANYMNLTWKHNRNSFVLIWKQLEENRATLNV